MNILEVQDLCKTYGKGEAAVQALLHATFSVRKGEFIAIIGESGSGKSTLLNVVGALDKATSGKVWIDGQDIFSMPEKKLTVFRRQHIGFIFQSFNLIPELNVEQNITFPLLLDYKRPDQRFVNELLNVLGLTERRHHLPSQLSGGQQQRVAIGRALVTRPALVLADEPTGNLDSKNSQEVLALLQTMSAKYRQTILMITHNKNHASAADRIFNMSDGVLKELGGEPEMKHYLDLVSISNKVHRRQSRMTRICIVLAVFLVAVMFGLADMYLKSMTDETRHQTGDWHCKITAIDEKTSEYIAARPEIDLSGWQGNIPTEIGCTVSDQPVSVAGMDETIFSEIYLGSVLSGEFPEIAGQVAVSSTLAQTAGISLGDTLTLNSPDGSTMQLAITGIMEDDAANMISGSASAILLTPEGLSSIQTADLSGNWQYVVRFSLLTNVGSSIADIQQQNGISDAQITQNEELLSMLGQLPGSNMSQIYTMAFLLSLVVMGTCVMMISSSLNSNVSQRMEFFGLLRCLGATRRQVLRFVRREALQWCITAIPIGIGLSIVVVWGLCAVMRQLSTVWFGYMPIFGISWLSIGVSIVLGLITVLLAARTPAKMAAKFSPLEAVTGNTQQESSFRHAANTRRWHVEVALGIHHAKAKRRSYILMTGAFAICITLFLGFCTLVPFMENAFMPKEWSPELSIVSDTNTCSIPADRRDAVVQNSAVSRVFGRMFAYDVPAQISGAIHNSNLISYEENQFRWAQDQLIAGSIDTVTNTPGQVLFVANTGTEVQVGDTITLTINGKDQTVTVGGVLSDSLLARAEGTETLICSEETFSQLTGETGYTILDVQFRFGSDEEDVAEVEALFGDGVTFTDVLIQAQQQRGLYYAFATLVYGFLSIIVAITIFHIMNTISMGVSARTRQYGVMRAIGMSNQQLTRMISAEAASYAISGVILGCIFGLLFHWFLYSSLITRTFGNPWSVPWLELCLIVGVILATTALAVRGPARRLHAMSIVENISSQ